MTVNGEPSVAPGAGDWLRAPEEDEGLSRYVHTLRERLPVIIATVIITTAVAIAYLATATKQYSAEADLLVTAQPTTDPTLASLPLIFQSSDPTRDVETAAKLVTTEDVAKRVKRSLNSPETPSGLLSTVTAVPVATSSIVSVTAEAPSPKEAQDTANGFAKQVVVERTRALHKQIDVTVSALKAQLQQAGPTEGAALAASLATLSSLRSNPDPSIRVEALASEPTSPTSPRPLLTLFAGVFGGLVLGVTAAFALQALDPRLRREDQLRRLYRLPILARIPKERRRVDHPLHPTKLSPATSEAYRSLRGTLGAASRRARRGGSRSVLVTGSSPSEGKTTTAISLASSLAAAGRSVILIEADLRRPAIGEALDVRPTHGIVSVLIESVSLEDALVTSPVFGNNLGLLLADYDGGWVTERVTELFAFPAAKEMVEDASRLADYVIIDSPPLTDVIDALPLANYVDDVLIVARLGKTRLAKLTQLGEVLAENGTKPAGFAVIGTRRPKRSDYHYYAGKHGRLVRDAPLLPAAGDGDPAGEGEANGEGENLTR